jgi:transmembrane sensor
MTGPAEPAESVRRVAEAAAWRLRLSEIDADSTEDFQAWLAADTRNEAALQRVDRVWDRFDDNPATPELLALRQAALRQAERYARSSWRTGSDAYRIAAAAVLAVGVAAWGAMAWLERPDVYTTQLGERRTITLSDGSHIALDSASELRVRYSEHARRLELVRGQARFEVAHDMTRPFSVHAGAETAIATGTDFDVDMPGPLVLVTLIEGHVNVLGEGRPVVLGPGEQLVQAPKAAPVVGHVDIDRIVAWENGKLIFDNEPLASVVARVSRYTQVPVLVADDKAGAMKISGVFTAGDISGFVDTVTRYLPLEAIQAESGEIRLRTKS